jgi:hypothetical protein
LAIRYRPDSGRWDNGVGEHPVPPYQQQFSVGSRVRVRARLFLEQFQREWKYHHPISAEQIDAAGRTDTVRSVGFYHGGDVLYQLSEIPGTWHEVCLESAL